ncbi:hypothetical protein D3C77_692560 [compost metagenome]
MDQRHDQIGTQPGLGRLAMYQAQQGEAFLGVGDVALETGGHVEQPDLGLEAVLKAVRLVDRALHQFAQFGFRSLADAGLERTCQEQQRRQ